MLVEGSINKMTISSWSTLLKLRSLARSFFLSSFFITHSILELAPSTVAIRDTMGCRGEIEMICFYCLARMVPCTAAVKCESLHSECVLYLESCLPMSLSMFIVHS